MKLSLTLALLAGLAACESDETISGYADPAITWGLQQIDGVAFDASATIRFPEKGRVEGRAPCNSYFANQTVPYPWIAIEAIGSTKMACPDLAAESAFFEALGRVTLAEILSDTLILSDESGFQMLFRAAP